MGGNPPRLIPIIGIPGRGIIIPRGPGPIPAGPYIPGRDGEGMNEWKLQHKHSCTCTQHAYSPSPPHLDRKYTCTNIQYTCFII